MVKKIVTYILLILFVASTTSIPMTETMCKMKGNFIGINCPMMNKYMKTCESKKSNHSGTNIYSNNNCCTTKTIDNSIKDSYVIHDKKIGFTHHSQFIHHTVQLPEFYGDTLKNEIVFFETSPASPHRDALFITNSSLLI